MLRRPSKFEGMVKKKTMDSLIAAAKFHVKVRTIWSQARKAKCSKDELAKRFQSVVHVQDAPLLRALCRKIAFVKYKRRRWAPVHPATSSVLKYFVKKAPDERPISILLAAIRARLFAQVSSRAHCWRTPSKKAKMLPYNSFGQALNAAGYKSKFLGSLACFDDLVRTPPCISRNRPLSVAEISKTYLGFRNATWSVSVAANDVALLTSAENICIDADYKTAQLSAGGVSFHGEDLKWDDVEQFRNAINSHKNLCEMSGGSFRITEGCHLVCETRQFYDFARHVSQKAFQQDHHSVDAEKVDLCNQLASWCVSNCK